MGNVSVREEGESSSGVEGLYQSSPRGRHASHEMHSRSEDLMGQSPPHSPSMSTQLPFRFSPLAPLLPLQRADDPYLSPNIHTAAIYEDMVYQEEIPTMFIWSHGGKEVAVTGSWDDWKTRRPLERSGKDFNIMEKLPSGFYQYKFIVDGEFRHAPDLPFICDEQGNTYNYIDLKDYVPENFGTIADFEPPQSPDSSYNNIFLGTEDFAKEPPAAPLQLQQTMLNTAIQADAPATWSRPQHVVLNHLYVLKGRSRQSPVALGSTYRFQSKYVTVVFYKSQQR